MNYLAPAQIGAMVMSILVSIVLAKWYFVPWSNRVTRRDALWFCFGFMSPAT